MTHLFDQRLDVAAELSVAHRDGIALSEELYRGGQLVCSRHAGVIDQNGDDRNLANIPRERRGDFSGRNIVRIVEPARAGLVHCIEPIGADDNQEDIARSDLAVQIRHEIDPGRNAVDVHEDILLAKRLRQPIAQATGGAEQSWLGGN